MKFKLQLLALGLSISAFSSDKKNVKPNIVLIMADDMGYSDIGCYGSEIPTPNLDALAANGLRFTQFYNTARCSPTRAALLTGLNPHEAGMGRLAEQRLGLKSQNPDGYLGYLNKNCITIAEALKPAGYQTYMSGKWHLGMRDDSKWPLQRGFDRFYGVLAGGSSYFKPVSPKNLSLNNTELPPPTSNTYYTTDAYTDFAIQTVKENKSNTPYFLYLAFNAPHWPLHAKPEDIAKFVGKYKLGWDELRKERYYKQKQLGIIDKSIKLSERDAGVRAWDALTKEEQQKLDYRMAVYAAQIYSMDYNIGRLIAAIREKGELENTLIVFLSDNGGSAEPYTDLGGGKQEKINDPNVSEGVSYGTGWANASNTPFKKFKATLYEGGISTPLIISWPAGLKAKRGSLTHAPGYLTDILPTFLEISGAAYPKTYKGETIKPLQGHSLMPILTNSKKFISPATFYWEQYDYKAIRDGNWKGVFSPQGKHDKLGTGKWELYDVAKDRTELNNLANSQPEKLKELINKWNTWASQSQVFPQH